ncbi:hypothetical protein INR49_015639 [Caranx melampygus]|nr:hypothetical protein INR49_015639 [Caranx melampygus]
MKTEYWSELKQVAAWKECCAPLHTQPSTHECHPTTLVGPLTSGYLPPPAPPPVSEPVFLQSPGAGLPHLPKQRTLKPVTPVSPPASPPVSEAAAHYSEEGNGSTTTSSTSTTSSRKQKPLLWCSSLTVTLLPRLHFTSVGYSTRVMLCSNR